MKNLLNKLERVELDSKKIALGALVFALVLYVDFAFIMKSQLRGLRSMSPKVARMKKDIAVLSKDLSRLQNLERNLGKDKMRTGAVKHKEIISEDKILLLLQEVSDLANKSAVKITQINTSPDVKVQEEVIMGERLLPLTISLDLSCEYHSLGTFINHLESSGQFIDVIQMRIVRDPRNYLRENVNLVIKTYAKK